MFIESKVYFNLGPQVPTWADGTDEEIAAALTAHYNGDIDLHDYWTVGDERQGFITADNGAKETSFVLVNEGGVYNQNKAFSVCQTICYFAPNGIRTSGAQYTFYGNDTSTYINRLPAAFRDFIGEDLTEYMIGTGSIGCASYIKDNYYTFFDRIRSETQAYGYTFSNDQYAWSNRSGYAINRNKGCAKVALSNGLSIPCFDI